MNYFEYTLRGSAAQTGKNPDLKLPNSNVIREEGDPRGNQNWELNLSMRNVVIVVIHSLRLKLANEEEEG